MLNVLIKTTVSRARAVRSRLTPLPYQARQARRHDLSQGLAADPGIERCLTETAAWLCRAQDFTTTGDDGVARHYSLLDGWGPSYPETTGYLIPTLIDLGEDRQDEQLIRRARRMLDWLLSIQLADGAFQGGTVNALPRVPVTFNTGQILLGLARGAVRFGEPYTAAMHRAARWLVATQDSDGCWRRFPSPFTAPGVKAYETHVAWGLLEAARAGAKEQYAAAAFRNIHWALTRQQSNGWFADCCVINPAEPLTHTLGYVLRGLIEGWRYSSDQKLLGAALLTGTRMLEAIGRDGFLPGRLDQEWRGTVRWACLTGTAQIAHCWLLLYRATNDRRFRDAAFAANQYVRRTINPDGPPEMRGAVRGSFPIHGDYGQFEYLNWGAKFLLDSLRLEQQVRRSEG